MRMCDQLIAEIVEPTSLVCHMAALSVTRVCRNVCFDHLGELCHHIPATLETYVPQMHRLIKACHYIHIVPWAPQAVVKLPVKERQILSLFHAFGK